MWSEQRLVYHLSIQGVITFISQLVLIYWKNPVKYRVQSSNFFTGELQRPAGLQSKTIARKLKSYDHWIVNSRCAEQTQSVQTLGGKYSNSAPLFFFFFYSSPVNKQVEISLFCTRHLIGWIWKCWNLMFQFCPVIGLHCLDGPGFSSRSVSGLHTAN